MSEYNCKTADLFGTTPIEGAKEVKEKPKVRQMAIYQARKKLERRLKQLGEEFNISRLEVEVELFAATGTATVKIVDIACSLFPNNLQDFLEQLIQANAKELTAEGDFGGILRIRRNYADAFVYEVIA